MANKNKLFDKIANFNLRDKSYALDRFRDIFLNKTSQIFKYTGLPDSIPQWILELYLQTNGNVFIAKHEGKLYAYVGGLGGQPDVYYQPTIYTVANPAQNFSKNFKIDKEGVLVRNDNAMQGLLPIIYRYGTILVESDISLLNGIINTRITNMLSASDDKTKASAEEYQKQIEDGYLAVIAESAFIENSIKMHTPPTNSSSLDDLRETYQYVKSLLYGEVGIKLAHNMKREYVSDQENISNDDSLLPLIDNMLYCRQQGLDKINKMFNTNITIELAGAWALQREEVDEALENIEEGGDNNEESEGNGETNSNSSSSENNEKDPKASAEKNNDKKPKESENK